MCVNKMDLVGWDRGRFEEIVDQVHELVRRLGVPDRDRDPDQRPARRQRRGRLRPRAVLRRPDAARVPRGARHPGRPRSVAAPRSRSSGWAGRRTADHGCTWGGSSPARSRSATRSSCCRPASRPRSPSWTRSMASGDAAVPPMSVTFGLADRLDVGRGDVLVGPGDQPVSARELDCTICWMSEEPLHPGRRYALKHTTRTVRATVQEIIERTDPETLERELEPTSLARQRHRPGDAPHEFARGSRPVRGQRRDRRVHPDRRGQQRHRGGGGDPDAEGDRGRAREPPRHHLAPVGARPRRALGGDRSARRDGVAHRAAGVGQVDDRGRARTPSCRQRPVGVSARRRQHQTRTVRGPRVLARRPLRAHPPRRPGGAADGGLRNDRAGVADLAAGARSRPPAKGPRAGQPAVRRGVRRHACRGMRAPRSQGSLRARPRGRDQGLHRRRRSVRAARASRAPGRHVDHRTCRKPSRRSSNYSKPGHGS